MKLLRALLLLLALTLPAHAAEIIVGAAPGGSSDRVARAVAQGMGIPTVVVHRPGGGGNVALAGLVAKAGDGDTAMLYLSSLISNHALGTTPVSVKGITPIALLVNEPVLFVVRADSPLRDLRDLARQLGLDPQSVSAGFATAAGNYNHMALADVATRGGADPKQLKVVVFKGGAEATAMLLGGHIQLAVTSHGNVKAHVEAGTLRVIGAVNAGAWRGLVGPPGMTAAQVERWTTELRRITQTEEWQALLDSNNLTDVYAPGREFEEFLDREAWKVHATLLTLGLLR